MNRSKNAVYVIDNADICNQTRTLATSVGAHLHLNSDTIHLKYKFGATLEQQHER
jgi:hypothetical protein